MYNLQVKAFYSRELIHVLSKYLLDSYSILAFMVEQNQLIILM